MRLFIATDKGLVLYEDGDQTKLSTEKVNCIARLHTRTVAGTDSGRILVWEGNGEARVASKDIGEGVHSLAASPKGALYAGSIPARAWVSKDEGETWDELPKFAEAPGHDGWTAPWGTPLTSDIGVHPKDPRTLYFGVEVGGIYRTRNGGRNFYDLGLPAADVHSVEVSPARPERVYIATSVGGFYTDDEGFNFKPMGLHQKKRYTMGLQAHPVEADRVIVSVTSGPPPWKRASCDVYLSTDAGRRFRTVAEGLKGGVLRRALVINPKVPSEVVFGTTDGEIHYSNDGGENFDIAATKMGSIQAVLFAS